MTETGRSEPADRRAALLSDLHGPDIGKATQALLNLTYDDPDREWVEALLLECLGSSVNPQIRALAVTCMGHVGRIHRAIGDESVSVLRALLSDSELGGRAEDALDDIASFVRPSPGGPSD